MKKNTIIALVTAIVAIVGTVVYLWFYDKKQNPKPEAKPEAIKAGTAQATPTTPASAFPLGRGSKGEEVKALQRKMNEYTNYKYFTMQVKPPYENLTVDGDFGPKTAANAAVIIGTPIITRVQYDKFINSRIILEVAPDNPYSSDPFNFLNLT